MLEMVKNLLLHINGVGSGVRTASKARIHTYLNSDKSFSLFGGCYA